MKYSWHCKKCGHTVISEKKEVVRLAREEHKVRVAQGKLLGGCIFVPVERPKVQIGIKGRAYEKVYTKPPTFARPKLAKILETQWREGELK